MVNLSSDQHPRGLVGAMQRLVGYIGILALGMTDPCTPRIPDLQAQAAGANEE